MTKSRKENQLIRDFIIDSIDRQALKLTKVVSQKFKISRQSANNHLKYLLNKGLITAHGATKNRIYTLKATTDETFAVPIKEKPQEHLVWQQYIKKHATAFKPNIFEICHHSFTQMFNNAVEHSLGEKIFVSLEITAKAVKLAIIDDGIGIFNKLQQAFKLTDPKEALLELTKGKLTSDEMSHTGESIFFTAKLFDFFAISSDTLLLTHTHHGTWNIKHLAGTTRGTSILMKINRDSSRSLEEIKNSFTVAGERGLNKTYIPLALLVEDNEPLLTRSQVKRVMARTEQFKEVVLDFYGVENIGQPFADELFRVFIDQHPEITVSWIHANPRIEEAIREIKSKKNNTNRIV